MTELGRTAVLALGSVKTGSIREGWPRFAQYLGFAVVLGSLGAFSCSSGTGDPAADACGPGRQDCGECTEVSASLLHCGSCGNACAPGRDCVNGQCTCVSGLTACGSTCVNVRDDAKNCGSCSMQCAAGLVCSSGVCSASCGPGLRACGSSCVDVNTSELNCGDCGRSCAAGQECTNGACQCSQGRLNCGSGCTDVAVDAAHCGRCNNLCPSGQACSAGVCRPPVSGMGGASGSGVGGSTQAGAEAGGNTQGGIGGIAGSQSAGQSGGGRGGSAGQGAGQSGSGGGGRNAAGSGGASSGGASGGGANGGGANGGGASIAGTNAGGSAGSSPGCNATGFHVANGKLYDVNCNEFIMRGVNYPYSWYASRNTQQDFSAIGATGANAIRIVMATGARWARVAPNTLTSLINWAKAARMVSILEVHDTTGYSEQSGSVSLSNATSYWTASDIAQVLKGQEAYVIVNIGNEPNGNNTASNWAPSHVTAVQALRSAGLNHALMIDAPDWGQDWRNAMRDGGGSSIWNADSRKNLIFSVHMYDVYGSSSTVSTYFNNFLNRYDAPLVVGEFASDHGSSGNVDEDAILSFAESLGVGYLGWSWSGNSSDLSSLDITNNFNASSLTTWGNRLISGANGIRQTSRQCSCFN